MTKATRFLPSIIPILILILMLIIKHRKLFPLEISNVLNSFSIRKLIFIFLIITRILLFLKTLPQMPYAFTLITGLYVLLKLALLLFILIIMEKKLPFIYKTFFL